MMQTAAYLFDHFIPNVPVRQWVLSLLTPFHYQFVAHLHLLLPVLQIIQCVISIFLIKKAGFKRCNALTGTIDPS